MMSSQQTPPSRHADGSMANRRLCEPFVDFGDNEVLPYGDGGREIGAFGES